MEEKKPRKPKTEKRPAKRLSPYKQMKIAEKKEGLMTDSERQAAISNGTLPTVVPQTAVIPSVKGAVAMRPGNEPLYLKPEDMYVKMQEYFKTGAEVKEVLIGREPNVKVLTRQVYTIIGLALYLGFSSRNSLYNYAARNREYSDVISWGKSMVARHYEGLLQAGGVSPSGMMFMLSNIDGMTPLSDGGQDDSDKGVSKITFTTINNSNTATERKTIEVKHRKDEYDDD